MTHASPCARDAAPRSASASPMERALSPNVFSALVLPYLDHVAVHSFRESCRYGREATDDQIHFKQRIRERWGEPAPCDAFDANPRKVYVNLSRASQVARAFHCLAKGLDDESRARMIHRRRAAVEYIFKHVCLMRTCVSELGGSPYHFESQRTLREGDCEIALCEDCGPSADHGSRDEAVSMVNPSATDCGVCQVTTSCSECNKSFGWQDMCSPGSRASAAEEMIQAERLILKFSFLVREYIVKAQGQIPHDREHLWQALWRAEFERGASRICKHASSTTASYYFGLYSDGETFLPESTPLHSPSLSDLESRACHAACKYGMSAELCHWIAAISVAGYTTKSDGLYAPGRLGFGPYAHGGRPTANIERKALASESLSTVHAMDGNWFGYRFKCNPSLMSRDLSEFSAESLALDEHEQVFFRLTIHVPPHYKPGELMHDVSIHRPSEAEENDTISHARRYEYKSNDDRKIVARLEDGLGHATLAGIIYHDSAYGPDFPRILLHGHYHRNALQGSTMTFYGSASPTATSGYVAVDLDAPSEIFTMWAS